MTAAEIMQRRTGLTDETIISAYVQMSTERVVTFLSLEPDADTTPYTVQIADIAVLLWQMDKATQNASAALGYESHSFSEGGVSESVTGANGQMIWSTYTSAINDVLNTLKGARMGVVRFL